jgi:hypothetical protein
VANLIICVNLRKSEKSVVKIHLKSNLGYSIILIKLT